MIKHRTTAWLGRVPGVPVDDAALIVGATLRLTRAVVTDDVGQWWVRTPAFQWAMRAPAGEERTRRVNLVGGLECPFCIGFHLGWLVLLSYLTARRLHLLGPWRFVTSALTLNYVTAHLGARLGDVGDEES